MKKIQFRTLALAALFVPGMFGAAETKNWPAVIDVPEGRVIVYQPQPDSLEGTLLSARAAVSVRVKSSSEPVFGAVWLTSHVDIDRAERTVAIRNVKVQRVRFADITPESEARFRQVVETGIPKLGIVFALDDLLAGLESASVQRKEEGELGVEPPQVIFRQRPAVLVPLDGEAVLRPLDGSQLMRVVNCAYLMVFDPASRSFYLNAGYIWYSAAEVEGPWKHAPQPPAQVASLVKEEALKESGLQRPSAAEALPEVIASTKPAELLVTQGEPTYKPLPGNKVLYVSNTESDVLMDVASQQHYILLSGRWYTSKGLAGPWSFVAPDKLPGSFASIPASSEKGKVRAQIPGTQEAQEAVIDAMLPQTAAVKRSEAKLAVEYDGEPEFKPIEKTSIQYAVNTSQAVFKVGNGYYSCDEGVWFKSNSAKGPWSLADEVPREIQQIPPSNPHYNTKYVYIYDSTPEVVYVGYTPSYLESYPYRGTVVYGTGYYYAPWVGRYYYYPRPSTFGFAVHYNPWTGGWGFGFSYASWGYGGFHFSFGYGSGWYGAPWYGPRPPMWWGPGGYWHGYHHGYWNGYWQGRLDGVHRPNRPRPVPYLKPAQGDKRIHASPTPYNLQQRVAGAENLYRLPANLDRGVQPGRPVRPGPSQLPAPGGAPSQLPAQAARPSQLPNNVLTDPEGNVFRNRAGGWEQRQNGSWNRSPDISTRPAPGTPSAGGPSQLPSRPEARPGTPSQRPSQPQARPAQPSQRPAPSSQPRLDSDFGARQRGSTRNRDFNQSRPPVTSRPAPRGRR